jgi:AI-2 transport protein TqsA
MNNSVGRTASVLVIIFLVVAALRFADVVFESVAFALFAIAIVWPLQKELQTRMPRGLALLITVLVTLVVIVKLTSMVAWGASQIAQWVPQNIVRFQGVYVSAIKWLEDHDIFIVTLASERFNVVWLLGAFRTVAATINSLIGFSLLIFIFMAMGLGEADEFRQNLERLGDKANSSRLLFAGEKTAKKFRQYMLVRTIASILTGVVVWGLAAVIGLDLAAAWGVITFALNYIPFIGPLIATVLPTLFAFVQFGSWEMALLVLVTLTVVQLLIGSYLEPLFTGKTLAISPFVVVFSVVFWGFLWGLPGTFIGVPIAIAALTLCEQYPSARWVAALLSGRAPEGPQVEAED